MRSSQRKTLNNKVFNMMNISQSERSIYYTLSGATLTFASTLLLLCYFLPSRSLFCNFDISFFSEMIFSSWILSRNSKRTKPTAHNITQTQQRTAKATKAETKRLCDSLAQPIVELSAKRLFHKQQAQSKFLVNH